MDLATILMTVNGAVALINAGLAAGKDIAPNVKSLYDRVSSKDPKDVTQEDLDAVQADNDKFSAELGDMAAAAQKQLDDNR